MVALLDPLADLSDEEAERAGERAHQADMAVDRAVARLEKARFDLGKALWTIRKERLYLLLDLTSFDGYLASKHIKRTTAYRYLGVVQAFLAPEEPLATVQDLIEMGISNAEVILPHVRGKTKSQAADLVADAKALTTGGLLTRIQEQTTGREPEPLAEFLVSARSQIEGFLLRMGTPPLDDPWLVLSELYDRVHILRMQYRRIVPETPLPMSSAGSSGPE